MNRPLATALAALVVALPWVLWNWMPAPTLELWYVAAHASEARLVWIALCAFAGVQAWRGGRRSGARRGLAASLGALALLGVVGGAVLEARSFAFAARHGVPLSPSRYLFAWAADPGAPRATVPFARVEGLELLVDVWDARPEPLVGELAPAIVRVHGGSWAFGTRSESPHWCRALTDAGCVVFDVDYRLTPPPRWKDAVCDVKGAVVWVRANAKAFGIDPERVVLMGASAGGHLALCAAYGSDALFPPTATLGTATLGTVTNGAVTNGAVTRGAATNDSRGAPRARVRAVIAFSPPVVLDIGFGATYPWWYPDDLKGTRRVEELTGGTPTTHPQRYRAASPIEHADADTPATLLLHGARDRLVWPANCERLAARLAQHGVAHRYLALPGSDHLFEYAPGGWSTQITEHAIARFLGETVGSAQLPQQSAEE